MKLKERSDSSFSLTPKATSNPTVPVVVVEQKSALPTPPKAPATEPTIHALALTIVAYYCAKAHLEQRDVVTAAALAMVQRCAFDMLGTVPERQKRLKRVVDSAFSDHRGEGAPTLGFIFGQLKFFRLRLAKLDSPPLAKARKNTANESPAERRSSGEGSGAPPQRGQTDCAGDAPSNDAFVRDYLARAERGDVDRKIAEDCVTFLLHRGGISAETLAQARRVFGRELT